MAQAVVTPLVFGGQLNTSKCSEHKQQEQLPASRAWLTRACSRCGEYGRMVRYCPKRRAEGAAQGFARDSSGSRGGRLGGRGRRGSRGKQRNQEAEDCHFPDAPENQSAFSRDDSTSVGSSASEKFTYVGGSVASAGAAGSQTIGPAGFNRIRPHHLHRNFSVIGFLPSGAVGLKKV